MGYNTQYTCGGFIIKKDKLCSQTALGSDPGPAPLSWMILNMGRPAWGGDRGSRSHLPGACSHHPLLVLLEHDVENVHGDTVEGVRVDRGLQEGQESTDQGGDDDQADEMGPGRRRAQL